MTIYSTTTQSGIDINNVFYMDPVVAPEYPAPPFLPGELAWGIDGSEFIFCVASLAATIAPGSALLISPTPGSGTVTQAVSGVAPNTGQLVAISGGGTGSVTVNPVSGTQTGAWFWAQRAGIVPALITAAPSSQYAQLHTSTTAGYLTSTGATANTSYSINGIVWSVSAATAGVAYNAIANYPVVSSTTP